MINLKAAVLLSCSLANLHLHESIIQRINRSNKDDQRPPSWTAGLCEVDTAMGCN